MGKPVIREATKARWEDLEALFASRGAPGHCWCMVWRATVEEARRTDGKSRKAFLKRRVMAGIPVGLLAYVDGAPVGWCSVAPKSTFRRLGGPEGEEAEGTWSIVCFFVKREHRGEGIAEALLAAAVALARRRKARAVEAYPVDEDSPSYRFMGFVPFFAERGFETVGRAGTRRHVLRLPLAHAARRPAAGTR